MLPLPRLPAVAALDSSLFSGTNWIDLTDGGNTTLHVHDIYTKADGTRAFTGDQSFAGYKAIAMACDNGTSFPANPSTAQWFYRTDVDTLFLYEGSWKPQVAFSDIEYYVDPAGTGDGYSSGDGAIATIQGGVDLVPPISFGEASVNIAAGEYNESVTIQGKMFPAGDSLWIIGALSPFRSGTCTSTGVKGTGATQGQYNDTDDCGSDAGKLVYHSNWGYRIVDTVEAGGSPDYGLICGVFNNQPQNGDQYTVYDWGVSVIGGTAFNVSGMIAPVKFWYIDMAASGHPTGIYAQNKSNVEVNRSRAAWLSTSTGSSIISDATLVTGASFTLVTVGAFCYINLLKSKVLNNSAGAYTMRVYYNGAADIKNGTVFDNTSKNSNKLVSVEMGSKLSCWTDATADGQSQFRNSTTGINCTDGGGAVNTGSGSYITYTNIDTNAYADDNSFFT